LLLTIAFVKKLLPVLLILLVAAPAEAKTIKPPKAQKFVETQLATPGSTLVAQLKARAPGIDVSVYHVKDCAVKKRGKRPLTACKLRFHLGAPPTPVCELQTLVKYKKKGSSKLVALLDQKVRVTCPPGASY
jgi:hypothetical protein